MLNNIKHSLRFKLTMWLMCMMTLTIFFSILVTKVFVKSYFLSQLKFRMENTYKDINTVFNSDELNEEQVREQLSAICANSDMIMFVLCEDGMMYSNTNEGSQMWNSMESIARLLLSGQNESNLSDVFDSLNNKGYYIFHQNYDERLDSNFYDLIGVLDSGNLVALRTSVTRFNESIASTIRLYTFVGIGAVLLGCVAMFLVSSSYVKPIHEMANVAKRMSLLDFDAKVNSRSKDEIGELGNSINFLSRELETTISELKTANAKLKKDIEEKTQIDEMRKEFLSHISHELKTPIALIQGYAEGLKENILDDPESRDFYCDVIMDEADRMNEMVKKLMALNELEFGTDKLNFERFDMVELIRNINSSAEILMQQANVTVKFDDSVPVYVWGDEFMLEEVYSNYLTNAIHYASEGSAVKVWLEERGEVLRVNVYNQGTPIPEDELDKIWIKFYKVDKARTREYGGSGIGLSIVAATMKLHGREYGAYNTEDGVVFYFDAEHAKPYIDKENS